MWTLSRFSGPPRTAVVEDGHKQSNVILTMSREAQIEGCSNFACILQSGYLLVWVT